MAKKFNPSYKLIIEDFGQTAYFSPSLINNSNLRLTPANKTIVNDDPLLQQGNNAVIIELPFTIEINVNSILALDGNTAEIKIYGLNEINRNKLFQNPWNIPVTEKNEKRYKKVILEAGYGKNIYPIFYGVLKQGYSSREGTDWITNLSCVSSAIGVYNAFINKSYNGTVKQTEIINDIISEMSKYGDLEKGTVTTSDLEFKGGLSLIGQSYNVMTQFGFDVFVTNGKLNVLSVNEVIDAFGLQTPNINANTGLIGTPILSSDGYVTVNTIFDPTLDLARLINLESETAPFFNGYYKIMGLEHKGVFSTSKDGTRITTLKMWNGGSRQNNYFIKI